MPMKIPIAWKITITVSVIFIIMSGLFMFAFYKLYKRVLITENNQKELLEKQSEENKNRLEESYSLIELQQKELEETKKNLEKASQSATNANTQIKSLSENLKQSSNSSSFTSTDLSPYLTGVVQVICQTGNNITSGSGTLFNFKSIPYAVVTNYHVVKDADACVISITNNSNDSNGIFSVSGEILTLNKSTDSAILTIGKAVSSNSVPVSNYNYSLSKLRKCVNKMPVGSPVVIIGFPAYAKRQATMNIDGMGIVNVIYRTVTNGIISGYDTSSVGDANYFVSAKIDNGNSGGMALSKDQSGICSLGLPTWLTVGNYETQGLVQNINNVLGENQ